MSRPLPVLSLVFRVRLLCSVFCLLPPEHAPHSYRRLARPSHVPSKRHQISRRGVCERRVRGWSPGSSVDSRTRARNPARHRSGHTRTTPACRGVLGCSGESPGSDSGQHQDKRGKGKRKRLIRTPQAVLATAPSAGTYGRPRRVTASALRRQPAPAMRGQRMRGERYSTASGWRRQRPHA